MSIPGSSSALFLAAAAAGAGGYQVERSLRFNSSDSASCARTFTSSGNRRTWTWAAWIKRSAISFSAEQHIWGVTGTTDATYGEMFFGTGDTLRFAVGYTTVYGITTTRVFRDPGAWFHVVLAFDATQSTAANKIKLYINGVEETTFSSDTRSSLANQDWGYNNNVAHYIGRNPNSDIRQFNGYLADVHFIDGQALTPSSFTEVSATTGQLIPKAYTGSFGTNGFWLPFSDNSNNTATTLGKDYSGNGNNWTPNNFSVTGTVNHVTSGLSYRKGARFSSWDTSSADTTPSSSVAADNYWWVDLGSSKTINKIEFDATITGTGSADFYFLYSTSSSSSGSSGCPAGCTITATRSIAGAAPNHHVVFTGFGSITGRYIGISNGTAGSSPTTFSNLRVLDDQGKDNDSLVDTPSSAGTDTGLGGQVTGNYATWNPLVVTYGDSFGGANGNLDSTGASRFCSSTIGVSSGKWYTEITIGNSDVTTGIWQPPFVSSSAPSSQKNYRYYGVDGKVYSEAGATATSYSSYTSGDVIGIALDLDNGRLFFAKNGTWQGSSVPASGTNPAVTGLSGTWVFGVNHTTSATHSANFGQRPFAYTAPSGFKALCDTNLPAPVVAKPNTVMDVALYTGNGSARSITGLGFSPDMVWIKSRSAAGNHRITDIVRGATKELSPDLTNAEGTDANGVTSFDANGFSLGISSFQNGSGTTYAAWTWDAGSSTVTNTQGSITSSVRANASAGFSIVTYTGNATAGATVGHGLGVAPALIINKQRSGTNNWWTYHASLGATKYLVLDGTNAVGTANTVWNDTAPTSTVFSIGVTGVTNTNSATYVTYCFAPVAGYSSFGSYTGNGSTDGPFVFTGFRPRWVLTKRTDTNDNGFAYWAMFDSARSPQNLTNQLLYANLSNAEATDTLNYSLDLLSNGFKVREDGGGFNANGGTYIYAAFAESPFQFSRAR